MHSERTAYALTMICALNFGRKVRCHIGVWILWSASAANEEGPTKFFCLNRHETGCPMLRDFRSMGIGAASIGSYPQFRLLRFVLPYRVFLDNRRR
jgi:hypothetical protein